MIRLACAPLAAGDDGLPLVADGGAPVATLWSRRLAWRCRDVPVDLRVLALAPVALPPPEPTEPPAGAIARVAQALRGLRKGPALLVLANPAEALGRDAAALAEGVRLFGIATDADEACWDAALSLGLPVYGVRGRCVVEVRRADASDALAALAFGAFACEEGLALAELAEDRAGTRWRIGGAAAAWAVTEVVVRGGFAAARVAGEAGEWRDRGDEGYVRLVARAPSGACWTQPRFIAPRAVGAGHG